MISYVPLPYPDELLYGHLVRYIRNTLGQNFVQISNELFGIPNAELSIDLPTRLQFLYNSLYKFIEPNAMSLLKYTLLPAYYPFLTVSKREYALQVMMHGPGTGIHAKIGFSAGSSNATPFPKFCPMCIIKDRQKFGEAYFHRVHQIPDIILCPHHDIFIQEYRPILENHGYAKILDPASIQIDDKKIVKNFDPTLLSISQTFAKILDGNKFFDINTVNYYDQLIRSKYSRSHQLKWDEITNDFEKFYGKALLASILKQPIHTWIKHIVHRPQGYFHPLRHILVTQFLETLTFKTDLFQDSFPEGPWQCINVASTHYNRRVVHDIHIEYSSYAKTRVATASCSCGMVYTLKFKSVSGKLVEVKKVTKYGDAWVNSVKETLQNGTSIRSAASKFGVSHKVIQRWVLNPNKVDLRKHGDNFQKIRDKKRKEWLGLLKNDSTTKISFAKAQEPKLYNWLYHNDPDWIKTTNATYRAVPSGKRKNDWQKIDDEISKQLSLFSETIIQNKFDGMISKNLLSKVAMRVKYFSSSDRARLPKTSRILSSLVESSTSFQLKKANKAIKELLEIGEQITPNKVMRKAGIKTGNDSTNASISKLIKKHSV